MIIIVIAYIETYEKKNRNCYLRHKRMLSNTHTQMQKGNKQQQQQKLIILTFLSGM